MGTNTPPEQITPSSIPPDVRDLLPPIRIMIR